jgi:predicted nuclease with TOPRIM domain
MSDAPERITAWLSKDGATRFEGGRLFPAGVEVEYIRADRIKELEAENKRLRDERDGLNEKLDLILDKWSSALYGDLENGVASLNKAALIDCATRYPNILAFGNELDRIIEGGNDE